LAKLSNREVSEAPYRKEWKIGLWVASKTEVKSGFCGKSGHIPVPIPGISALKKYELYEL
jgi:hypothetical protein